MSAPILNQTNIPKCETSVSFFIVLWIHFCGSSHISSHSHFITEKRPQKNIFLEQIFLQLLFFHNQTCALQSILNEIANHDDERNIIIQLNTTKLFCHNKISFSQNGNKKKKLLKNIFNFKLQFACIKCIWKTWHQYFDS